MNKPYKHHMLAALIVLGATDICHAQTTMNPSDAEIKNENHMTTNVTLTEQNKNVLRTVLEEAFNQRKMELLKDLISDDYVGLGGSRGAVGFQAPILQLLNGFPDGKWNIRQMIAEDNKVLVSWSFEGTHTGSWQSIAPTGKKVSGNAMGTYELRDGKIIKANVLTDRLGFLQALEVLPTDVSKITPGQAHPDQVRFIDKFVIPAAAKDAFLQRVKLNRDFIKTLPGFIEDHAYTCTNHTGDLTLITIALWENQQALSNAKEKVQAEYQREGFDPAVFMKELGIVMDRGVFQEIN